MRAFGNLGSCALLHRLPKQSAHKSSIQLHTVRAFSALPHQTAGDKQQTWLQHLVNISLGVGAGAGLLAAYGAVNSSRCEQQASAGQTQVSNSSWFHGFIQLPSNHDLMKPI